MLNRVCANQHGGDDVKCQKFASRMDCEINKEDENNLPLNCN